MNYRIVRNDISEMSADAIVLPANPALVEGPGASAALFEKAGRGDLKRACKNLHNKLHKEHKDIAVGTAVATLAYKLSADYIVHAIVPKWIDGNHHEYGLLSAAYLSSLGLADAMGCKSIAFPLLAAGNNGYDVDLAFQIAGRSIEEYQPENTLETVYIVLYGYDAMGVARKYGYSVEEFIDQKAVFLKEDEKKRPVEKLFKKGQDFANGVKDKGLEQAMAFLDNEENQDKVLERGKKIAADAIRFGIDLAKDKIKNKQ